MGKDLYVKGYGGERLGRTRLQQKRAILVGILVLAAVAWGLFRWIWQDKTGEQPLPLTRNMLIRRIPPPPIQPSGGEEPQTSKAAAELQLSMEARAPAQTEIAEAPAAQEPLPAAPQAPPVETQEDGDLGPAAPGQERVDEPVKPPASSKPDFGTAKAGGVVIQVGAFRRVEVAEALQNRLQAKGYDVYLDKRTLKQLGLLHRVRVRGYSSIAEAQMDMARIEHDVGAKPFAIRISAETPGSAGQ